MHQSTLPLRHPSVPMPTAKYANKNALTVGTNHLFPCSEPNSLLCLTSVPSLSSLPRLSYRRSLLRPALCHRIGVQVAFQSGRPAWTHLLPASGRPCRSTRARDRFLEPGTLEHASENSDVARGASRRVGCEHCKKCYVASTFYLVLREDYETFVNSFKI